MGAPIIEKLLVEALDEIRLTSPGSAREALRRRQEAAQSRVREREAKEARQERLRVEKQEEAVAQREHELSILDRRLALAQETTRQRALEYESGPTQLALAQAQGYAEQMQTKSTNHKARLPTQQMMTQMRRQKLLVRVRRSCHYTSGVAVDQTILYQGWRHHEG